MAGERALSYSLSLSLKARIRREASGRGGRGGKRTKITAVYKQGLGHKLPSQCARPRCSFNLLQLKRRRPHCLARLTVFALIAVPFLRPLGPVVVPKCWLITKRVASCSFLVHFSLRLLNLSLVNSHQLCFRVLHDFAPSSLAPP